MLFEIHESNIPILTGAAELILRTFAFDQGQNDAIQAKRESWAFRRGSTTPREEYGQLIELFPRSQINEKTQQAETVFLEFTKKELSKMPKFFQTIYKLKGGKAAHIRQKENGTYEIRYRRNGINLSVSSKNLSDAKERFIQALCTAKTDILNDKAFFGQYAMQWLEVVKKPQVKENTYSDYLLMFKAHIFPKFGKMRLRDVKPLDVQKLINGLYDKKTFRIAEKVYILLNALFAFAVSEDLIAKSPMALIRKPKYETKHGQAFTIEEERAFVEKCLSSNYPYRYALIFLLFTGIRRSELNSVQISSQWVTVITSKTRKGVAEKSRKIPISPMLRPFLPFMTKEALTQKLDTLTRGFSKLVPGRHLHELRHTFITRCQECGISRELTSLWAGHKADNTMTSNVYTHFSEEFQIGEIQKLRY